MSRAENRKIKDETGAENGAKKKKMRKREIERLRKREKDRDRARKREGTQAADQYFFFRRKIEPLRLDRWLDVVTLIPVFFGVLSATSPSPPSSAAATSSLCLSSESRAGCSQHVTLSV